MYDCSTGNVNAHTCQCAPICVEIGGLKVINPHGLIEGKRVCTVKDALTTIEVMVHQKNISHTVIKGSRLAFLALEKRKLSGGLISKAEDIKGGD